MRDDCNVQSGIFGNSMMAKMSICVKRAKMHPEGIKRGSLFFM